MGPGTRFPRSGTRGRDLRNLNLDVTVESPDGDEAVRKIAEVWKERCPIYLALLKPTDVAVQFGTA